MKNYPLPRLDLDEELRERLLPYCRLRGGEIVDFFAHSGKPSTES